MEILKGIKLESRGGGGRGGCAYLISVGHICDHEKINIANHHVIRVASMAQWEPRENEGTEREAPGPALGICHVHESYF